MKQNKLNNIKEAGFKVPKDYFENFDDVLLSSIKIKELSDRSGFKIPKNYLETLEYKILDKVSEKENIKVISLFNRKNFVYASSIAAAILLLFNLSIFERNITFDSLDIETAENYIINEGVDSYEIANLLTLEELTEENFIDYNFNEENIESYIVNHIDIESLMVD